MACTICTHVTPVNGHEDHSKSSCKQTIPAHELENSGRVAAYISLQAKVSILEIRDSWDWLLKAASRLGVTLVGSRRFRTKAQ